MVEDYLLSRTFKLKSNFGRGNSYLYIISYERSIITAEIGRLLGRSQSTIWRELKKGATVNVNELSNDALLANKHGLLTYSVSYYCATI
ncbi:helix-turn-helix domain-containing protein [Latilactobacillus sakei]